MVADSNENNEANSEGAPPPPPPPPPPEAAPPPPAPPNPGLAAGREVLLAKWLAPQPLLPAYKVIITLNVIAFIGLCVLNKFDVMDIKTSNLMTWGANVSAFTLNGDYWRLLSSMFLHGGLLHIAMNMVVLLDISKTVERLYGSFKYLLIYFVAGIGGGLFSMFFSPNGSSVGASGAVFGIYGALLAFYVRHLNEVPSNVIIASCKNIFAFIVANIVIGLASARIDNAAHMGGLIFGFLQGIVLLNTGAIRSWSAGNAFGTIAVCAVGAGIFCIDQAGLLDHNGVIVLTKVEKLLAEKKNDEAFALLNKAVEDHPDSEFAYEIRGLKYLELNDLDKALPDIEQGLKINPKSIRLRAIKAEILTKQAKFKDALAEINSVIEDSPADIKARAMRMFIYMNMDKFEQALGDSNFIASKTTAPIPEVDLLRVSVLGHLNKNKEALELCDKIAQQFPKLDAQVSLARISVYRKDDDLGKIKEELEAAIKRNPDSTELKHVLCWHNFETGKLDEAISGYQAAIAADKKDIRTVRERGLAYFMKGDVQKALADFEAYNQAASAGDEQRAYSEIFAVYCCQLLKDPSKRKELLDRALQRSSKDWPYPILQYLNDQITQEKLEDLAVDNDKMTEAKAYIGLRSYIDGNRDEANKYFNWVIQNGNKEFIEYDFARLILDSKANIR